MLQPRRLKYKQDDVSKVWDLLKTRGTVVAVVHNKSTDSLVMVKQFRPAVLVAKALKETSFTETEVNAKLRGEIFGPTYANSNLAIFHLSQNAGAF